MLIDLILKILFCFLVFCGTTICGIALTFYFIKTGRWLTKIILSFCTGFIILALGGIAANVVSINVWFTQLFILIICGICIIPIRTALKIEFDRNDCLILTVSVVYIISLIAFFDWIVMWMAGDAVAHASIIRMLIDREAVPVSIYPIGSYWDYYPKAFHFYSFFWANGSSVLSVVQVIPVLISAVTPVILYSVLRELKEGTIAVYAFVFACVCFPAHYTYLIWAGYPSIAAEMLLLAAILSLITNWKLLPIFFIGILITHTRFVGYLILILLLYGVYLFYESNKNKFKITPRTFFAALALTLFGFFTICLFLQLLHPPSFLISLVSDRTLTMEYMSRWFWAVFALFGLVIVLIKKESAYQIFVLWFIAVCTLFILADMVRLNFFEAPDRILSLLYIPLSVFAAILLGTISDVLPKSKTIFLCILIIFGFLGMGTIFYNYSTSWKIPNEDYHAIVWLERQQFNNTVSFNIDETGAWVYPLTGIRVINPLIMFAGEDANSHNYRAILNLCKDPNDFYVLEKFRQQNYDTVVIFISYTSRFNPDYVPPFSRSIIHYQQVNMSFSDQFYELLSDNGAYIYRFKNNN